MITKIAGTVEEACAGETNIFGYGIWTHHITQVAKNGKRLAEMLGADPEIVELAALLHDYASVKDKALYKDHHIHSATEAEKLLRCFGYPQERIEAIKECIAAYRGSVPGERRSTEAECLANADAMRFSGISRGRATYRGTLIRQTGDSPQGQGTNAEKGF